jgi:hypothetical protein
MHKQDQNRLENSLHIKSFTLIVKSYIWQIQFGKNNSHGVPMSLGFRVSLHGKVNNKDENKL